MELVCMVLFLPGERLQLTSCERLVTRAKALSKAKNTRCAWCRSISRRSEAWRQRRYVALASFLAYSLARDMGSSCALFGSRVDGLQEPMHWQRGAGDDL